MLKWQDVWWPAELHRVVDGDTFYATIDRGFHDLSFRDWRLARADTWEMKQEKGPAAKTFTTKWFADRDNLFYLMSVKNTKGDEIQTFERWVAEVKDKDGNYLVDALREAGMLKE